MNLPDSQFLPLCTGMLMPASQGCCQDEQVRRRCSAVSAVFSIPLVHPPTMQSRAQGLALIRLGWGCAHCFLGTGLWGAALQAPYLVCGPPGGCYERRAHREMGRELPAGGRLPSQSGRHASESIRLIPPLASAQVPPGPQSRATCLLGLGWGWGSDAVVDRTHWQAMSYPCSFTCSHPECLAPTVWNPTITVLFQS